MTITFLLPRYPTISGGFKAVYQFANHLTRRNHEVIVVHPRRLDDPPAPNQLAGLARTVRRFAKIFIQPSLHWQPLDKRVKLVYTADLAPRHIPEGDAVVATFWKTAEHVIRYPVSKGRKFYLVMDFDPWAGPRDRLEATWRSPLKKLTISRWLYEKVVNAGASPDETINIALGINHQIFRLIDGISARPKRVVMLYSLMGYKVPEDGLHALEIAKARHPDLEGTIFGPLPRRPRVLPSWLTYEGNVPETSLVEIYNGARVYVCCSLAEGFAFPPAEAMACGCAVTSTDCGGVREYAEPEVNALLSPPHNPEALAANIVRLLEDDNLRQRLARAGHERIQEYTWDRSTDLLEAFVTKYVGQDTVYSQGE